MRPCSLLLSSSLLVCACSAGSGEDVGSIYVKTVDVSANAGALIEVTAADSRALAGTRLLIPPGALSADTRISLIYQPESIVPAGAVAAGPTSHWGPAGLTFQGGATLTVPYELGTDQRAEDLLLAVLEESGERSVIRQPYLTVDAAAGRVSATIAGFTRFEPATANCEAAAHPELCDDQESCQGEPITCCQDADGDGHRSSSCGGTDCDDLDAHVNAASGNCPELCSPVTCATGLEICNDGIDNDVDGSIDCDDTNDCHNALYCACQGGGCVETCDNGLDDDADGDFDCNDSDCAQASGC